MVLLLGVVGLYSAALLITQHYFTRLSAATYDGARIQTATAAETFAVDLGRFVLSMKRLATERDFLMASLIVDRLRPYERAEIMNRMFERMSLLSLTSLNPQEIVAYFPTTGYRVSTVDRIDQLSEREMAAELAARPDPVREVTVGDDRVWIQVSTPIRSYGVSEDPTIVMLAMLPKAALQNVMREIIAGYGGMLELSEQNRSVLTVSVTPDNELVEVPQTYAVPNTHLELTVRTGVPVVAAGNLILPIVILTLVSIAAIAGITLFIRTSIMDPLGELMTAFGRATRERELAEEIPVGRADEMGTLFSYYNETVNTTKELLNQVVREQEERRTAQLHQLQQQVQPHFLENAFFLIYRMAKLEDVDGVKDLSRALQQYYRIVAGDMERLIPLKDEIEHACAYLEIQRFRHGDSCVYHLDVRTGNTDAVYVLPMVLQPLLENAYIHGPGSTEDAGVIEVTVDRQDRELQFTVADSGGSASAESALERVRAALWHEIPAHSVGIRNLRRRLDLSYGEDYAISAECATLGGIAVELRIPISETPA